MRILGIDYGEKKIGLAISDPTELIAQRLETIKYEGEWCVPANRISEIINQYSVKKIVVGLPKNMNGTLGNSCKRVLDFCEFLKSKLNDPSMEIINWDERLSTVSAIKTISDTKVKRSNRRQLVDQVAASFILQSYLDSKSW